MKTTGAQEWYVQDEFRFIDDMAQHYPNKYGGNCRPFMLNSRSEFLRSYISGMKMRTYAFNRYEKLDEDLRHRLIMYARAKLAEVEREI